ncbi:hypothetical protein NKH77_25880 [Streptomyces sp. M19]
MGVSEDEFFHDVMDAVSGLPDFEESREVMEVRSAGTVQEMHDSDFTFALNCAIAGIEALRDQDGTSTPDHWPTPRARARPSVADRRTAPTRSAGASPRGPCPL